MTKFTAKDRAWHAREMYLLERDGRREVRPCPRCGGKRDPVRHNYRSIADYFTERGTPVSEALVGNMIEEYVAYKDLITKELQSSAPVVDT